MDTSNNITAEERDARQIFLETPREFIIKRQKYSMVNPRIGATEACVRWNDYASARARLITVHYNSLLDVAVPTLVRMSSKHFKEDVPSDISGVTTAIMDHMEAVGNFMNKLVDRWASDVVGYATWYLNQTFEHTYPVMVETDACRALLPVPTPGHKYKRVVFE